MRQIIVILLVMLSIVFGIKQLEDIKYNSQEINECVRKTELEKTECKMQIEVKKKEDN